MIIIIHIGITRLCCTLCAGKNCLRKHNGKLTYILSNSKENSFWVLLTNKKDGLPFLYASNFFLVIFTEMFLCQRKQFPSPLGHLGIWKTIFLCTEKLLGNSVQETVWKVCFLRLWDIKVSLFFKGKMILFLNLKKAKLQFDFECS